MSLFRVTHPEAPALCVDENARDWAERVKADCARNSPVATGRLAASWTVSKNHVASYEVVTDVEYAPYVEFGTRFMHGAAMMGRALAKARGEMRG